MAAPLTPETTPAAVGADDEAPAQAPAEEAPEGTAPAEAPPEVRWLRVDAVDPSPTNPRETFDPRELRELADSIAAQGLLQPPTVRPHPDPAARAAGRYELVAGERRWRAHGLLGRPYIAAIVRDLADADVLILQTVENVQRADVPPLEEARGFARLLGLGLTPAQAADRVGKEAPYIRQRAALADLIPAAQAALTAERITLGAALELARVGADAQAQALPVALGTSYGGPGTAKAVRAYLEREVLLQLARAPFDRRDKTLAPAAGPCTRCPKRTAADGDLFADFTKKDDRCLDGACFAAKLRAHVERRTAAAVARMGAEGFVQVYSICDTYHPDRGRAALGRDAWTPVNPDDPRHARCPRALGVYDALSKQPGDTLVICARGQNCPTHYPAGAATAPAEQAARTRAKAKAIGAERRLLAAAAGAVAARAPLAPVPDRNATALPNALLPLIAAQFAREMQDEERKTAARILGVPFDATGRVARLSGAGAGAAAPLDPAVYGVREHYAGSACAIIGHVAALAAAGDAAAVARVIVVLALAGEAHGSEWGKDRGERIRALAGAYGVDLAPLYREAAAATAPKRAGLTPDAVTLPHCPRCGAECASFLLPFDGACPACRAAPPARAGHAEDDEDGEAEGGDGTADGPADGPADEAPARAA